MGHALSNSLATSRKRPNHIPALDGVRLVAVGLVILHHLTSGAHTSFFLHLIDMQHDNGIGPPLFFVLSGTLLTKVILDARNAENRYRNFLLRRMLRIFPLYFGYLGLLTFATWIETGKLPSYLWSIRPVLAEYLRLLRRTYQQCLSHLPSVDDRGAGPVLSDMAAFAVAMQFKSPDAPSLQCGHRALGPLARRPALSGIPTGSMQC